MTGLVSPFHDGERQVQARLGALEHAERVGGRGIRAAMPDQHREFFAALPYVFVASLDAQGRPWSSILHGAPGFISSPNPKSLIIGAAADANDPAGGNFGREAPIGVIGIDLATRRRNRVNGRIIETGSGRIAIAVDLSFGNCPQYIQAREILTAPTLARGADGPRKLGALLDIEATALLSRADTAFIASASAQAERRGPAEGADASHRGGRPGFLRHEARDGRSRITIPDFAGNRFYNTLGNIAARPRAGLLIPDFETGAVLTLTGGAGVIWEAQGDIAFEGAERFLTIDVDEAWMLPGAMPWRWTAPAPARQLARTGVWRGN